MEPCRRRAIWAAQANQQEIKHEQKDETRNDADAALPEGDLDGSGRGRDHQTAVQDGTDETRRSETSKGSDNTDANKPTAKKEVNKYACPKCGREVRRGMYFHKKYCKG